MMGIRYYDISAPLFALVWFKKIMKIALVEAEEMEFFQRLNIFNFGLQFRRHMDGFLFFFYLLLEKSSERQTHCFKN